MIDTPVSSINTANADAISVNTNQTAPAML